MYDEEQRYQRLFAMYRDYVKHQYELLNHRTNWYILIQSFLFVGLSFSSQALTSIDNRSGNELKSAFYYFVLISTILSVVGVYTSYSAWFGVKAAGTPIQQLQDRWKEVVANDAGLSSVKHRMPVLLVGGNDDRHRVRGVEAAIRLPLGLGTAWVLILIMNIRWMASILR